MRETERITSELVDPANEFDLAVVPEVDVVRGILRVHARGDDEDQIAFSDHLHGFHASFDAALDSEAEGLQRENRKAFGGADRECILFLVEADMSDGLISKE